MANSKEIIIEGIGRIHSFLKNNKSVKYSLIVGSSVFIITGSIIASKTVSAAKIARNETNIETVSEYITDYKQQLDMKDLQLYLDLRITSEELKSLPEYCEMSDVLHDLKLSSYDEIDETKINGINKEFMSPDEVMQLVEQFKELKSGTRFSNSGDDVIEYNKTICELRIQESLYNQKISDYYSLVKEYGLDLAKIIIAKSNDDVNISDLTIYFDDYKHNHMIGDELDLNYRVFNGKVYTDSNNCVLDINRLEIDNKLDNRIDDILESTLAVLRADNFDNEEVKSDEYNADRNKILLNSYYTINDNFAKEYGKLTDSNKKR